ncbi:MAG: hypothetical protein H0T43_09770 [Solirubrobacterales bacterium]|nr:hypothetical protein [Solirubrobacterales bacterium]
MRKHEHIPPDLLDAAKALEEHRPQLTDLELDHVKRRAITRGSRTTPAITHPEGSFMRSRLAIMATLVTGLLMSGSGAALGVTAISNTNSASEAQYGAPAAVAPQAAPGAVAGAQATPGAVLGTQVDGATGDNVADDTAPDNTARGGVAGDRDSQSRTAVAQAPRQLESGTGSELPFTGYASIPLLLLGIALLATGLVLRRRTQDGMPQG